MAYNYVPYEYSPVQQYRIESDRGESYQVPSGYADTRTEDQRKFQDYAGEQFKGLFDMANANPNPLQGFAQTPTYSPYSGTREDFTTHTPSYWEYNEQTQGGDFRPATNFFDQKGYLDARFGNINNYLSGLSSFLGNMSGDSNAALRQAEAQRAMSRANMPTIGMSQPMGTPQMGSNPALSGFGGGGGRLVGKGWGTHPAFKGLLAGGGE